MENHGIVSAKEALEKLKAGNEKYINSGTGTGDISPRIRLHTYQNGQKPYAIVIGCSDSRVIPESIFSAGIGDLFVVRTAGNVIDNLQLGSIEYAVDHLGCRLIVVLGHTNCGAVYAALKSSPTGYAKYITDEIKRAIGTERDYQKACCLNIRRSISVIEQHIPMEDGLKVVGALYHIDNGRVDFDF